MRRNCQEAAKAYSHARSVYTRLVNHQNATMFKVTRRILIEISGQLGNLSSVWCRVFSQVDWYRRAFGVLLAAQAMQVVGLYKGCREPQRQIWPYRMFALQYNE